jgi:DNA-binding transcriptional LysR family regulator
VETLRRDRLLVALPEDHLLVPHKELRIADLQDEEFVIHAGRGRLVMNSLLTALYEEAGYVPRVRHEVEETSTLVTLVAAGVGVAIVPEPTAALGIAGVSYRPLVPDRARGGLGGGACRPGEFATDNRGASHSAARCPDRIGDCIKHRERPHFIPTPLRYWMRTVRIIRPP